MQWANSRPSSFSYCCWAGVGPLFPFGSKWAQAWSAERYFETETPSCSGVSFGNTPLLFGSGKFDTPPECMHCVKANAPASLPPPLPLVDGAVVVVTFGEGDAPHADSSRPVVARATRSTPPPARLGRVGRNSTPSRFIENPRSHTPPTPW